MIRLGTRLECVESSPGISGPYQDNAREFIGRRPRLVEILSGVAERLARRLDDIVGARREFTRTSPKVSGRSLETRWEIARRRP
ncbi:hypothetical protein B296_00027617 [Ensete ventricosum]|uniref:Uncharacterized protein n=1 Tax=Ensete ventricosum TaxID=4639 RepID=A0A426ZCX9_ENSVE|nr:hypothetical protein B296_00027617 [Ensete ventricosum]